ncbi:hypothetical protein ACF0H5_004375 [Mactra antiquata]
MPLCHLHTNMKRGELPEDIEESMAKLMVTVLGTRLQHVFVMTHYDLPAYFAGSREPGIVCQLYGMKYFDDKDVVKQYYPNFFEFLKEYTKLPGNRIVIQITPVAENYADLGS